MSALERNATITGHAHPDTSHAAAKRVLGRTGSGRRRVLQLLVSAGSYGATDEEIHYNLTMPANTARPRRVELVDAGYVKASGNLRATVGGSPSIVWVATDAGRHALSAATHADRLANPTRSRR